MARAQALTPLAHVKSVPDSLAFYRLLGFETLNTFTPPDRKVPTWAAVRSGRADLMLGEATEPVVASKQAILFYLYCDDVQGLRNELLARGIAAGPIQTPFYALSGEFRIEDPDGYVIMVTHT
jgi:hypothetical protein